MIHVLPIVITTVITSSALCLPQHSLAEEPCGNNLKLIQEMPSLDTSDQKREIEALKRRIEDLEVDVDMLQRSLRRVTLKLLDERQQVTESQPGSSITK